MELGELYKKIADHWGGLDATVHYEVDDTYFIRSKHGEHYIVYPPEDIAHIRDIDGRPLTVAVPEGKVAVVALDDAPDCWWYVNLDGSYKDMMGKECQLV